MPKVIDLPTSTSMSDSDYLIMEQSGGGTKKIMKQHAAPLERYIQRSLYFGNGTATRITFSTSYRGILMIHGTTLAVSGVYLVFNTTAGFANMILLSNGGTSISVNNQTVNTLIITVSGADAYGILLGDSGTPPTIS